MSYFPFFTSLVDTFFLACYHHGFTSAASPKCCLYKQKEPTVMKLQADGYAGTTTLLQPLQPGALWEEGSFCTAIRGQTLNSGVGLTYIRLHVSYSSSIWGVGALVQYPYNY